MKRYPFAPKDKDPELWELARKRASFKSHLGIYLLINVMLWALWFLFDRGFPWPLFVTGGWGIGIVSHYFETYSKPQGLTEKEYQKLLAKKEERDIYEEYSYKRKLKDLEEE